LHTAETSFGSVIQFIPASITGCSILNISVILVFNMVPPFGDGFAGKRPV
jgi:hypothetical protein